MRIDDKFYKLDATAAAPLLVGKLICFRNDSGEVMRMRIIETECYMGEGDTACHASKGKTERNSTLWMEGGYSYVYLCYGMYQMFNVITGNEGDPQGVLIRGVEGYYGPGKFTKYAGIDRSCNRIDMKTSDRLWVEDDGFVPELVASARVGIDYAAKEDRERLWRFTDSRYFKK
jgi:DNA-3-methyladenine glycosylase